MTPLTCPFHARVDDNVWSKVVRPTNNTAITVTQPNIFSFPAILTPTSPRKLASCSYRVCLIVCLIRIIKARTRCSERINTLRESQKDREKNKTTRGKG